MPELSLATEAVLNAVTLKRYDVPYYACLKSIEQIKSDVAAALRAAVQQCTYEDPWGSRFLSAEKILAIANELDNWVD
jgi:hypothetical protein